MGDGLGKPDSLSDRNHEAGTDETEKLFQDAQPLSTKPREEGTIDDGRALDADRSLAVAVGSCRTRYVGLSCTGRLLLLLLLRDPDHFYRVTRIRRMISLLPGIGNSVEILGGGQIGGQTGWVLIPADMSQGLVCA